MFIFGYMVWIFAHHRCTCVARVERKPTDIDIPTGVQCTRRCAIYSQQITEINYKYKYAKWKFTGAHKMPVCCAHEFIGQSLA